MYTDRETRERDRQRRKKREKKEERDRLISWIIGCGRTEPCSVLLGLVFYR